MDKFFLETIDHIKKALQVMNNGSRYDPEVIKQKSKLPFAKYGKLHWDNETFTLNSKKAKKEFHQEETQEDLLEGDSISQNTEKIPNVRVDLKDLDWQEKEKIIRILYTKINMGVTPGYWRQIELMVQNREEDEVGYEVNYDEEEGFEEQGN